MNLCFLSVPQYGSYLPGEPGCVRYHKEVAEQACIAMNTIKRGLDFQVVKKWEFLSPLLLLASSCK